MKKKLRNRMNRKHSLDIKNRKALWTGLDRALENLIRDIRLGKLQSTNKELLCL